MPLLVILTWSVQLSAEANHFSSHAHESILELQLLAYSLTLFLQSRDKSLSFCAKVKQQYKERQLHNGFSDLPWTGNSFKPCNEYSRFTCFFQEI